MTEIPIPKQRLDGSTVSYDELAIWLGNNIRQDFEMGVARWSIVGNGYGRKPHLRFRESHDATFFCVLWN